MPDFFASIMRFIRATAPSVPLDPVIFQSIMLSVMAGNKHVILRAKDEDITIVQNLAALVSNLTLFCPLACDCPLLSLDIDSYSPSPLPCPSGMSSSCSSDIQRYTRLHNSQTQDNAAIRRGTLVFHLIRLFFSVSRNANGKTGPLIQKARKASTLPPEFGKLQTAGQRTKRFITGHVSYNPARTSRREIQTAIPPRDSNTIQFIGSSRG